MQRKLSRKIFFNHMNISYCICNNDLCIIFSVPTSHLQILKYVYTESTVTVLCSWLYSICWIVAYLILALRCVLGADFHYVHVKVEFLEVLMDFTNI